MFVRTVFVDEYQSLFFVWGLCLVNMSEVVSCTGVIRDKKGFIASRLFDSLDVEVRYCPSMTKIKLTSCHRVRFPNYKV